MNPDYKKSIESMTQGIAYWVAYSCETSAVKFVEAEAVGEIANILQNKLHLSAHVKREVDYRSLAHSIKVRNRADLGIFIDGECKCLFEVKLAENTNGGFKSDIKKLAKVKQINPSIECYVILIYRNSCGKNDPKDFVSKDGKALRKTINVEVKPGVMIPVRVRRVANAIASSTNDKMKRVVCIEVL